MSFYNELNRRDNELKEINRNLSFLSEISQAIHQSTDLDQIYRTILDAARDLKFIDLLVIYLVEGEGDKAEAVLQIHMGYTEEYLKRAIRIPYPVGNTWKVIESGEPIYYEDVSDPSTSVEPAGKELGQRALLSIPMKSGGETIGVVHFSSFEKTFFTQCELNFLLSLGSQVGTAIAKAKMFEEMKQLEKDLKQALIQLSKKNRYETIVSTVTRGVHQSINLQDVLENAVDTMSRNIDEGTLASVEIEDRLMLGNVEVGPELKSESGGFKEDKEKRIQDEEFRLLIKRWEENLCPRKSRKD